MGDDKVPKLKRKFYPKSFQITNWDKLEGEFKQLLSFEINSPTIPAGKTTLECTISGLKFGKIYFFRIK